MSKAFIISAVALSTALAPIASGVHADANGFEPVVAEAAWSYDGYSVERLPFTTDAIGPYLLGDLPFVAEPTGACRADACALYNLVFLSGNAMKRVQSVPAAAFSPNRIEKNGGRLVFAQRTGLSENRWDVKEITSTGEVKTLLSNVFFSESSDVQVFVSSTKYFFQVEFNHNDSKLAYRQAAVYVWNQAESKALPIAKHFDLRREEIQDVYGNFALVKMVFEKGNKELWIMEADKPVISNVLGSMTAIPGTWTEPHGDIVAAHLRSDGSVEYFQYFARYTFNPKVNATAVRHDETITWFRPIKESYQLSGDRLAFVNADDTLFLSDLSGVKPAGTAAFGRFTLGQDTLYFASAFAGVRSDLRIASVAPVAVAVSSVHGTKAVGVNGLDQIAFLDRETGIAYDIGHGTSPVIGADNRPIWKGNDGRIYVASVFAPKVAGQRAVKVADNAGVFLVKDGQRYTFTSERVYFTYFPDFTNVETVTTDELNAIPLAGIAQLAPGTLVRLPGEPKNIFVLAADGRIHRIADAQTATSLFGADWPTKVVTMTQEEAINTRLGGLIQTARDLANI